MICLDNYHVRSVHSIFNATSRLGIPKITFVNRSKICWRSSHQYVLPVKCSLTWWMDCLRRIQRPEWVNYFLEPSFTWRSDKMISICPSVHPALSRSFFFQSARNIFALFACYTTNTRFSRGETSVHSHDLMLEFGETCGCNDFDDFSSECRGEQYGAACPRKLEISLSHMFEACQAF